MVLIVVFKLGVKDMVVRRKKRKKIFPSDSCSVYISQCLSSGIHFQILPFSMTICSQPLFKTPPTAHGVP